MDKRNEIPMNMVDEIAFLRRRVAGLESQVAGLQDAEKTLRESEKKYRLIAEHSGDCLWVMDLATLRFTYVSPSVRQIYGFTVEETIAQSIEEVMPPQSLDVVMKVLEEELAIEATGAANPRRSRTIEVEEYRKDRSLAWIENVLSFLRDERQRPVAILGVSRDVTERRRFGEELRKLAITDPLTGAYNRRYFMEELQREMTRSDRYAHPFSLVMLDIDHFKAVNDRFGHEAGDRVLRDLVELIRNRIRTVDLLARWGGEEFLILLVSTDLRQAVTLAGDLLERLRARPFPDIGLVTASFGITNYRARESVDELLTRVDDFMYQAKRNGRARIAHDPPHP
jgi:diguanylate cyclase (GGDEF)-like protein/PAS domain S-box-containing protein